METTVNEDRLGPGALDTVKYIATSFTEAECVTKTSEASAPSVNSSWP